MALGARGSALLSSFIYSLIEFFHRRNIYTIAWGAMRDKGDKQVAMDLALLLSVWQ